MTDVERVVTIIPVGKANALKRQELSFLMGVNDRRARQAVEDARAEGYLIINQGSGYYLADDIDDIEVQYKLDTARAMSILKRRKTMRKILRAAGREV